MSVLKYRNATGQYVPLSNYTVQPITPVQATGNSTTAIMSQNAVTVELNKKANSSDVYTKADANSTFLSKTDATNNYLTKTDASNTYTSNAEVQNIVNQTVYGTTTPTEAQTGASVVTTANLATTLGGYQEKLTAGDNITISGNTISANVPGAPDLSGYAQKATTLAGYGITDAKIEGNKITLGTNNITPLTAVPSEYVTETELTNKGYATTSALNSGLSGKSDTDHTHGAASSSANGFLASTDKSWIDFMNGATTATSIASVPVSKHMCVVTISANGSFSLASKPAAGREVHVIVRNSGSGEITVTIPTSGDYVNMSEASLKIAAGKYADINVLSDGSKMYVRAL